MTTLKVGANTVTRTYFMNLNDLCDGDVDDGFSDARNVRILVNVKHHFRLVNVTYGCEELPTSSSSSSAAAAASSYRYQHYHTAVKHYLHRQLVNSKAVSTCQCIIHWHRANTEASVSNSTSTYIWSALQSSSCSLDQSILYGAILNATLRTAGALDFFGSV